MECVGQTLCTPGATYAHLLFSAKTTSLQTRTALDQRPATRMRVHVHPPKHARTRKRTPRQAHERTRTLHKARVVSCRGWAAGSGHRPEGFATAFSAGPTCASHPSHPQHINYSSQPQHAVHPSQRDSRGKEFALPTLPSQTTPA